VEGDQPEAVHHRLAGALDEILDDIATIQRRARADGHSRRPRWPMIVLRTPKGWTGPKEVEGVPVEGTFRSHQVPVSDFAAHPDHLRILEDWMRSYRPEELFTPEGRPVDDILALAPRGARRMSATPHANGGLLLRDLRLPAFRDDAVPVDQPGTGATQATRLLGRDDHLAPDGRVMEVLSEHLCQGWLEGYLLTGRHGLFNCYEAFIHIVDSMLNQHAKWLKSCRAVPWRRPIASLNYLLSSHVWRQDHNGFSHQDPGFIDHVVNKKAAIVRVSLPPDANCLLSVADHCLRSRDYVNVIVAGKQPALAYLSMDDAVVHCTRGVGIWSWASNDAGVEPDVVLACAGDIPTLECLAATALLRERLSDLPRPRRQRRRPAGPATRQRAPPWAERRGVRRPLHHLPPGDLRLPRLPMADPPAHLSAP
jgi:xylulose-5-phosphate/fructose-6-phosphate phosphoketolase